MSAAAFVEDAWEYGGVRIAVFPQRSEAWIMFVNFETGRVEGRPPADPGQRVEPSWLHLDEASARVLLDALARHFGGMSETVTLRKDYEAERARVDKLIDYATSPPIVVDGRVDR